MVEFYRETEFKETPVGNIPKEWRIARLKDILKEVDLRGKNIRDAEKLPILSLTKDFGLIPQEQRFHKRVAADDTSNYKVVKRGWLVYNPYVIWEGAICVLRDIEMGLVSPVYPVWEPTADVDYRFLYYLIRTKRMLSTFFRLASGVVQRRRSLKKKDFLEILIPLPPLEEQKLIARVLYSMDEAIQAVDASIAKWERLKRGLMQELLTKGIGHKEFKEETEIGKIPKDWEIVELKDKAHVKEGIYGKRSSSGDIIQLKADSIEDDGRINPNAYALISVDRDISKYLLKPGDILLSNRNSKDLVGKVAIYRGEFDRCVFSNLLTRIRVYSADLLPDWLLYVLMKMRQDGILRALGTRAVNQVLLRKGVVEKLKIPLPPLKEQKRIVKILSSVDAVLEEKRRKKAKLERMKKAVMDLLLTGKVRVRA